MSSRMAGGGRGGGYGGGGGGSYGGQGYGGGGGYGGGTYGRGGSAPTSGRDRMGELRAAGVNRQSYGGGGALAAGGAGTEVTALLDSIASADQMLRQIKQDMQYIRDLQRRAFDAVPDRERDKNSRELDDVTQQAKDEMGDVRKELASLDQGLNALQKGTADYVMCANQLVTVKKKFQDQLKEFQQMEMDFGRRQKETMLREMRVVDPNASMQDVNEFVETGQGAVFAQQVLQSNRYGNARRALQSVQDRQVEIQEIERTVEELAQMFIDLNTMVEQQDYQINIITENVEETVEQLDKGEQEVEKAVEIRKNTIKWSWYLCGCVLILIIAGALFLLFSPTTRFIDKITGGGQQSGQSPPPANNGAKAANFQSSLPS